PGAAAADIGVRHRALPTDGRRYPFPSRLRIYACDYLRTRVFLRHRFLAGQPGEEKFPGPWQYRLDDGDADYGFSVPADPQLDPGAARQILLSRSLRLPAHAGGVRSRAELGNGPRRHAGIRG